MRLLVAFVCQLAFLLTVPQVRAESREETRVVVAVGNNVGLAGERPLDYAEDDARRFRDMAVELGGVQPERAYLLHGATGSEVLSTLAVVRGRLLELSALGPTALLLYVSAHGDKDSVHLSGTRLSLGELRSALALMPTRFRLIIVDACQTPAMRTRGGQPGPDVPVAVEGQTDARGEVFIASASPGEPAQEWSELGGGLFTHHLLAALRGVADFDRDGNISLTEAYSYAYRRTVADAALASERPQRPRFDFQFQGFGDFRVTRLGRLHAGLVFGRDLAGRILVLDSEQKLLVDLTKSEAAPLRLALRPGWYRVVLPEGRVVRAADVSLAWGGTKELAQDQFVEVPRWRSRLRGSEPLVLRPGRLRVGYALGAGSVAGLDRQHWLELETGWYGGRGFALLGLSGSAGSFRGDELRVVHHEARLRLGGGVRTAFGPLSLLVGLEAQTAWVHQLLTRDDAESVARVFGVREKPRDAVWLGLAATASAEFALSERVYASLALAVGASRLVGGNRAGAPLLAQARAALGWSF